MFEIRDKKFKILSSNMDKREKINLTTNIYHSKNNLSFKKQVTKFLLQLDSFAKYQQ